MIEVVNVEIFGWAAAIRGMRNPMNSWGRSDSYNDIFVNSIGKNDFELMQKLIRTGPEHRKFLRMIHVQMDIKAPLYWWKEFDTYKVGTVANSCSTMHKITAKPIEVKDFSCDDFEIDDGDIYLEDCFINVVADCEMLRKKYLETKDKRYWRGLIQLLPSSYNQQRTVDLNYEVAMNMIRQRTGHKLSEWNEFVDALKKLPYMEKLCQE